MKEWKHLMNCDKNFYRWKKISLPVKFPSILVKNSLSTTEKQAK